MCPSPLSTRKKYVFFFPSQNPEPPVVASRAAFNSCFCCSRQSRTGCSFFSTRARPCVLLSNHENPGHCYYLVFRNMNHRRYVPPFEPLKNHCRMNILAQERGTATMKAQTGESMSGRDLTPPPCRRSQSLPNLPPPYNTLETLRPQRPPLFCSISTTVGPPKATRLCRHTLGIFRRKS